MEELLICKLCGNEFKELYSHIRNAHNITKDIYLEQFPGSKMRIESLLEINRQGGKYVRDEQFRLNASERFKKMHERGTFKNVYTEERNNKISECQKKRWDKISTNDRSAFWKENVKKIRLSMGEDGYRKHMGKNGAKSFSDKGKKHSNLELEICNEFQLAGIKTMPQYEIDGYYFDLYLPEYNILVEIDGDFWHPKSLDECKYDFQKSNYKKDKRKDKLCKSKNIQLIRIRESEKRMVSNIIENILHIK
jgi:very-short-patch-repair endonuclease